MKISKIFYLSLLIISVSLILAFCLKILFFSSNNKSVLETNSKYFDKIYFEYKMVNRLKHDLLTEKQFINIFHCFFVLSQLEFIDYGEMIIYILEKNPILIESYRLNCIGDFVEGFHWLLKFDQKLLFKKSLLHKKEDHPALMKKFEKIKFEIRTAFKDKENNTFQNNDKNLSFFKFFNNLRSDIKAIFNTTSINVRLLQKPLSLLNICITNEDIFVHYGRILMNPALFYAIDFIKRNWSKHLSEDMINNVFSPEFTTPQGTFSYFYISLYSWF